MDYKTYSKLFPLEYVRSFLAADCREDGRDLSSVRQTTVDVNNLPLSNGSSIVTLGKTTVICGVKLEVGVPTLTAPREGSIVVKLTFPPSAGAHIVSIPNRPAFEMDTNAMTQQLQDYVGQCGLVDLDQLCIIENTAVWVAYVDIVVINDDGNVLDAAILAMSHALMNTKLPPTVSPDEKTVFIVEGEATTLQVNRKLAPLSFALIDQYLVADPSLAESRFAQSTLTVILDDQGNVCGMQKPGGKPISDAILGRALQSAAKRAGQLKVMQQSDSYPMAL
jgi:exosome complex component RRP43